MRKRHKSTQTHEADEQLYQLFLESSKPNYTDEDLQYYTKLSKRKRDDIDDTEAQIDQLNASHIPLRFKVLEAPIDMRLKQVAVQKIDELAQLETSSSEYFKLKNWVDTLVKLPINKYKALPVTLTSPPEAINDFIKETQGKLNTLVYGHQEAKSQIMQLLAKLISNPQAQGTVIGINGPMGSGKTTLFTSLAECLQIPFAFVSLAGTSGEATFKGHSYTYVGSRWGKIVDILLKAQCMNPIIYFDELDKISNTYNGEEVMNFLVHLTDFSQNHKFQDHYFGDIDLDLSRCIFLFSYNDEKLVNPILKDRMVTIRTNGYKPNDKVKLAREFMLPKIFKEFNLNIDVPNSIIEYIINKVEEEQGARNLKRGLEEIIGSINYKKILGEEIPQEVTKKIVDEMLITNKKVGTNTLHNMMYC